MALFAGHSPPMFAQVLKGQVCRFFQWLFSRHLPARPGPSELGTSSLVTVTAFKLEFD